MERVVVAVIAGTARKNRKSIHAASLIADVGRKLDEVEVIFVDPADLRLPADEEGQNAKDPYYTETTAKADAFFIIVPEYNHGYPGILKRVLDTELENYRYKPVALAGVSSGPWGGVRAVENLAPVLRKLGLVAICTDIFFPSVDKLFDETGTLLDEAYVKRIRHVYDELIQIARVLKKGRGT